MSTSPLSIFGLGRSLRLRPSHSDFALRAAALAATAIAVVVVLQVLNVRVYRTVWPFSVALAYSLTISIFSFAALLLGGASPCQDA